MCPVPSDGAPRPFRGCQSAFPQRAAVASASQPAYPMPQCSLRSGTPFRGERGDAFASAYALLTRAAPFIARKNERLEGGTPRGALTTNGSAPDGSFPEVYTSARPH